MENIQFYKVLFQNAQCAPNVEFTGNSCYPLEVIEEIYNNYYNDDDNKNDKVKILYNKEYKEITLNELNNNYKNFINNMKNTNKEEYKTFLVDIISQLMLLEKNKVLNEKKNKFRNMNKQYNWLLLPAFQVLRNKYKRNDFFRPKGPNNNNNWLSNFDIEDVLKQYEKKYNDFKMLGAVPRDFKTAYCKNNYKKETILSLINQGKTKFGSVFNLDTSKQSGSHWVALFVDVNKGQVYYCDSVGKQPRDEFKDLMNLFEDIIKDKNIKIDERIGTLQHQHKNTECGVYSINFILRLLNGESFDYINSHRLSDDDVEKCRIVYFNNKYD